MWGDSWRANVAWSGSCATPSAVIIREADDPVFRNASDGIEKPRRTGYPACAAYDDLLWRRRLHRLPMMEQSDEATRRRHSGMVRERQTRNLEIPGSMLRIAPE